MMNITELPLSTKARLCLLRNDITTVEDLLNTPTLEVDSVKYVGGKVAEELFTTIEWLKDEIKRDPGFIIPPPDHEERAYWESVITSLPEDILNTPVEEIRTSGRLKAQFQRLKVKSLEDVLRLTKREAYRSRGFGDRLCSELEALKQTVAEGGYESIRQESPMPVPEKEPKDIAFDFDLIRLLTDDYFLTERDITEFTGLSRQAVNHILHQKRVERNRKWTGHPFAEHEKIVVEKMIADLQYRLQLDNALYRIYNDMNGRLYLLIARPMEIRAYSLEDLPKDIRESLITARMNVLSEEEMEIKNSLEYVTILKEKRFKSDRGRELQQNARLRGMSADDYYMFLAGCPRASRKTADDTKIIAFLEKYRVKDNVVSIPADATWLKRYAASAGMPYFDLIRLFGYEPNRKGE